MLLSVSVSVSFYMFQCSEGLSIRAYLGTIQMTLVTIMMRHKLKLVCTYKNILLPKGQLVVGKAIENRYDIIQRPSGS